MCRRGGSKRALGARKPTLLQSWPNERWSLDFFSDAFTHGRWFRVLAVVDDYSRECPPLVDHKSLSGHSVTRELNDIIKRLVKPGAVINDDCAEMTFMAVLKWCQGSDIEWH